jgi:hypothetical protein
MRRWSERRRLACMDRPIGDRYTVRAGGRTHRFFFLSGCYRSGTNWVSGLLNLHPRVCMTGEFHFRVLLNAMDSFTACDWYLGARPALRDIADEAMENLIRRCIYSATRERPDALWLGDHTPRHMREHLPGAPHVLVVRDGRDVLVSFAFHILNAADPSQMRPFNRERAEKFGPAFRARPEDFRTGSVGPLSDDEWVRQTVRAWAEFMRSDLPEAEKLRGRGARVHTVRYEDLHTDLEGQRNALYRFLELDPAEAATPSESGRTTPGFKQEDPRSFFRKGQSGDWRNYFDERLSRIFKEEAGEELVRVGYETGRDW